MAGVTLCILFSPFKHLIQHATLDCTLQSPIVLSSPPALCDTEELPSDHGPVPKETGCDVLSAVVGAQQAVEGACRQRPLP